jgi:hypothetical protein
MGLTSAFTSAVLLNFLVLQFTGVDYEFNKQKEFGLPCIAVNDLQRDDTQRATGSSPVRPTKFFPSFTELSLVFRLVRGISKFDFRNYSSD